MDNIDDRPPDAGGLGEGGGEGRCQKRCRLELSRQRGKATDEVVRSVADAEGAAGWGCLKVFERRKSDNKTCPTKNKHDQQGRSHTHTAERVPGAEDTGAENVAVVRTVAEEGGVEEVVVESRQTRAE